MRMKRKLNIEIALNERIILAFSYTTVILLIILFTGGSLGLPVALSVSVGGSMYPSIRSGDMNVLVSTALMPVNPGDVAVYEKNGIFVIHRVKDIENGTVIFKGDNNVYYDKPVPIEKVKYKVVANIPYYIWGPIIASLLVTAAFTPQIYLRRRHGEGYTIHTFVILLFFIVLVTVLSSSVFVDKGLAVKPAPAPKIVSISKISEDRYIVTFNFDPVSVTCKNAICHKTSKNSVEIHVTKNRSSEEKVTVWIHAKLPTSFNTTATFMVST